MNIVIINPIAATPTLTPSSVVIPRVPSLTKDLGQLRETNIMELGAAITSLGHQTKLILGGPYLDEKEWDLGHGLRVSPVKAIMRFPFHPGLLPMTPGLLGHPALREADVIQVGEFHQLATLFASIAAREAAIPLVAWQETFRPMRFPGSFYQRFYNRSLGRHVLKTASRFVPRTTKARTYLKELGVRDADITSWIPTGVDLDTFAPMKSRYLPEDFGFKTDTKILLVVARLQRDKGVDIALRVTKQLSRDYPNIGLIVAGEGPERANLHRLAKDLGISESVRLVGQVPREELVHLCNAADIVLSTSRNDLLPIALIEASACGCPCIVTDIGAIRDIVVDGVTGIVVQERRIDAFSEAILSTLRDDALRIAYGNAARNRMELHFSLPKIAENLLEVYRNACN